MNIKSETQSLESIFTGVETRYAVPHYQRDYSWSHDHRLELWNDIHSAFIDSSDYFLGSFVLNTENLQSTGKLEIVDGQQRLTTLSTLFAVIRDISNTYLEQPENPAFNAINRLDNENNKAAKKAYLKANQLIVHYSEPDNFFLELNSKDQPIFRTNIQEEGAALLTKDDQKAYTAESRLLKAKKFFSRKIVEVFLPNPNCFPQLERFINYCMTKLLLLRITVGNDTDAYLLIETLNDRGLDLSISDLVKNRLLMGCNGNEANKKVLLTKWNELITKLHKSRFQAHDFLRFYWCAFHVNCTKKELYKKIKEEIDGKDGVQILDAWNASADYFSQITDREIKFPSTTLQYGSIDSIYAELKTIGYSVYLPLFLKLYRDRPKLLDEIAPVCLNYLFRVISVGNFSAGRAEERFNNAIEHIIEGKDDSEIIECFLTDKESIDEKFLERLRTHRFEENKTAKYILSKIHLHEVGAGHPLNSSVHLEHVMPQSLSAWPDFNLKGRAREDWVYNLGNMTLLEDRVNQSLQAKPFDQKVVGFKQRTNAEEKDRTAIPMSYSIHQTHVNSSRDWDNSWITERAGFFAEKALSVWPLDLIIDTSEAESETDKEIDNSEQI